MYDLGFCHDNEEDIEKFITLINNKTDYKAVPDIGFTECSICNVNSISGVSYINNFEEATSNYCEIEIRGLGYDNFFVCLNCAIYFSNKKEEFIPYLELLAEQS